MSPQCIPSVQTTMMSEPDLHCGDRRKTRGNWWWEELQEKRERAAHSGSGLQGHLAVRRNLQEKPLEFRNEEERVWFGSSGKGSWFWKLLGMDRAGGEGGYK